MHDKLTELEEVCLGFIRPLRKANPSPILMLSHGFASVGQHFPAIGAWVQGSGCIEVGRRKEGGFVARALDSNDLIIENNNSNTLARR